MKNMSAKNPSLSSRFLPNWLATASCHVAATSESDQIRASPSMVDPPPISCIPRRVPSPICDTTEPTPAPTRSGMDAMVCMANRSALLPAFPMARLKLSSTKFFILVPATLDRNVPVSDPPNPPPTPVAKLKKCSCSLNVRPVALYLAPVSRAVTSAFLIHFALGALLAATLSALNAFPAPVALRIPSPTDVCMAIAGSIPARSPRCSTLSHPGPSLSSMNRAFDGDVMSFCGSSPTAIIISATFAAFSSFDE